MLSLEEATARILSRFHPLEAEPVPLLEALGRVLAEDVYAAEDVPPFSNSSMDGYALRAADTRGAAFDHPVVLRIVADIAAGSSTTVEVLPGTAARINTGAPIPLGADAMVRFEDTSEARLSPEERRAPQRGEIAILVQVAPGANVRPSGEDIRRGQLVLARGTPQRPFEIGVLASLGRSRVSVIRKPRVGILATGDELVDLDQPLGPGQVRDSNEYSLAALVLRYGGIPVRLGIARDRAEEIRRKLEEGCTAAVDLFLTSAGVSVGAHDWMTEVLAQEGDLELWKVAIRPGKPLAFGNFRGVPLLGLPGNPVSAAVTFELFARPALLIMQGRSRWAKPTLEVILEEDLASDERTSFLRAVVSRREGAYYARTTGPQGSHVLTSLSRANALVIVPAGARLRAGERAQAQMLDWPEEIDPPSSEPSLSEAGRRSG